MKEYWFYLESYVFIDTNERMTFIYNTISKKSEEFKNNAILEDLIRELMKDENMYCISVNDDMLNDSIVRNFVNRIIDTFSGDLVSKDNIIKKPLIFFPKVSLQKGIRFLQNNDFRSKAMIMKSLTEINFQLTGKCDSQCKDCDGYYKQTLFCHKNNNQLNKEEIITFMKQLNHALITKISLTGGNIFLYPYLEDIISYLNENNFRIELVININHIENIINNMINLSQISYLKILVNSIMDFEKIKLIYNDDLQTKDNLSIEWIILISDEDEYDDIVSIIEKNKISNYRILPFYNTKNIDFFKNNIFLSKDDILSSIDDKKTIFTKKQINIFDFGKLFISSKGYVYSNYNLTPIGTISTEVSKLLLKELQGTKSWRRTRYNMKICSECIYKIICPSPSNYEFIFGRPDLCKL